MMRWTKMILTAKLAMLTVAAAGCSNPKPEEKIVLRVNYPFANQLYQQYVYEFEKQHPNIRIEAVDPNLDSIEDTALYPDIVFMYSRNDYNDQIERESLASLEPIMGKDREGGKLIDRLSPVVTDLLRNSTDNELYALSAYYSSGGLFYNTDLFRRYGIPLPTNRMSWSELLQLASRFPDRDEDGKPLFGFATNYYQYIEFSTFLEAGRTEGLSFIHPKTLDVSIDTEKWRKLYESVIRSASDGGIYNKAASGAEPFYTGEAAMQLLSENAPASMVEADKFYKLDPVEWGVVTAPANPEMPEYSDYYSLYGIFGISANTRYKEEAWEFIKFAVGDTDNLRRNMARGDGFIPAVRELGIAVDGHDMSALTMQRPGKSTVNPYDVVPYEILDAFLAVGQEITERAIRGELSAEDALHEIQLQGQAAVNQAKLAMEPAAEAE